MKNLNVAFLKKFFIHIQSKLSYKLFIIYIIVITLPVVAFSFISYRATSQAMERDFITYKQQITSKIITNIDRKVDYLLNQSYSAFYILEDIQYVLREPAFQFDETYFETYSRINSYALSILQGNRNINGITLIDIDGVVKFHMDSQMLPNKLNSFNDMAWFKKTLELNGASFIREPHIREYIAYKNTDTQNETISVLKSVKASDNKVSLGIIIFEVDSKNFWGDVSDFEIEPSEILSVIGSEGNIIYTQNQNNTIFDSETLYAIKNTTLPSFKLNEKTDEVLINVGSSKLTSWTFVSVIPVSSLKKKSLFIKNINNTLLIVIILFILLISLLISNLITSNLKKLLKSFNSLKSGDFNANVTIKGVDELAQIGLGFNSMVLGIKNMIQEKYKSNILKKQAQLQSLESQINPHFLYNTLAMMKDTINNGNATKSSLLIQNLSDIFRYCLSKGKHIVEFSDELEHVRKYLDIMSERYEEKFKVFYDIDSEAMKMQIPRLTIQPIVENAINHGFEEIKFGCEIHIAAKITKECYHIYIFDNGKGISEEELKLINQTLKNSLESDEDIFERIGIFNVNARIKHYFGNAFGIKLSSVLNQGTTVKITLPFINERM